MFVKITKSGPRSYVQLVEAFRDEAGHPRKKTIATLGRLDQLNSELDALIQGLLRATGRDPATAAEPAFEPTQALGDTWAFCDQVQSILATNCRRRGNNTRVQAPALLKGMIFTADGRAMTPYQTRENGRLYRYYVSTRDQKEGPGASPVKMLPAGEDEEAVLEQVRGILGAPAMVMAVWRQTEKLGADLDEAQVAVAMHKIESVWEQLFPAEQQRLLRLMVESVIVRRQELQIKLRPTGIEKLALEFGAAEQTPAMEAAG